MNNKKTDMIQIRVSPEEKKIIKDASVAFGRTLSAYVKDQVMAVSKGKELTFKQLKAEGLEDRGISQVAIDNLCVAYNGNTYEIFSGSSLLATFDTIDEMNEWFNGGYGNGKK